MEVFFGKLFDLFLVLPFVAAAAVLGGDQGGDQGAFVHEAVDVAVGGLVAVEAVDAGLAVRAVVPLHGHAGVLGHVAVDAFLALGSAQILPDLARRTGRLGAAELLLRLAKAGEYRDSDTSGHVFRMANTTRLIAETLPGDLEELFRGAAAGYNHYLRETGMADLPDARCR